MQPIKHFFLISYALSYSLKLFHYYTKLERERERVSEGEARGTSTLGNNVWDDLSSLLMSLLLHSSTTVQLVYSASISFC